MWNVGQPNPGAASLGLLKYYNITGNTLVMFYDGGDPVPPPGPPDPGARQCKIVLTMGDSGDFTNFKFIDDNQNHKPGDPYIYEIDATGPVDLCGGIRSCSTCASSQCAWCNANNKCISSSQVSSCPSWVKDPKYCYDPCSQQMECHNCTMANCNWCYSNDKCSTISDDQCGWNVDQPKYCIMD